MTTTEPSDGPRSCAWVARWLGKRAGRCVTRQREARAQSRAVVAAEQLRETDAVPELQGELGLLVGPERLRCGAALEWHGCSLSEEPTGAVRAEPSSSPAGRGVLVGPADSEGIWFGAYARELRREN